MKILRTVLIFPVFVFLAWITTGCAHAQVTPTNHQVNLTWTAPAASGSWGGCTTSAPCTYEVSRIALTTGATSCPAPNVATPNYTPLAPATGTTFADTGATGLTACYIVQTEQGGAVSQPSNTAGPLVIPANPLAPSLTGNEATAAPLVMPLNESPAPVLSAQLR